MTGFALFTVHKWVRKSTNMSSRAVASLVSAQASRRQNSTMILTKGKKLYSVLGCVLIWFSSFNLWWSICGIMFAAIAIVVLFYYMVKAKNWKKRLLFGTMLAFAGTDFCTNLYPAWQVPFGWVVLTLIVWIVITNQEWKKYHGICDKTLEDDVTSSFIVQLLSK